MAPSLLTSLSTAPLSSSLNPPVPVSTGPAASVSGRPLQVFPKVSPAPLSLGGVRHLAVESIWGIFTKSWFADGLISIKTHYHAREPSLMVKVWVLSPLEHFGDLPVFISSVIPEGERNSESASDLAPCWFMFLTWQYNLYLLLKEPHPQHTSLGGYYHQRGLGPQTSIPLNVSCDPLVSVL